MIDKANANKAHANAPNVQFIESAITSIALADNVADCIISNCVINLVPKEDKQLAFNEMFRLLKPGGRLAISDILARKEFTEEIKNNLALYVGCIAGASQVSEYDKFLKNAGFDDVLIVDSMNDLNVYCSAAEAKSSSHPGTDAVQEEQTASSCCITDSKAACCKREDKESCCPDNPSTCSCQKQSKSMATQIRTMTSQLGIADLNEWAGSFQVYAIKPEVD
ncbi:hypothetical protein J3458_016890 [Metarhizium acridum]|uniref:uncharacterized protein n=1 Tax=Metarhizium acridum TaxID=92637 RepID=UPI001C6C6A98|nr:hypothetical protein J3458_016890 [Metarhizium acridum]